MKIIACLGNPGKKYNRNRHNIGFIIGEYLARACAIQPSQKVFSSFAGQGKIDATPVLLLFPQTFMNNSGIAVAAALEYYRETPDNLIVIHDEIELPFGEYRVKFGGGHKGHNGIRSILQHINSPDFHRLRFGVGRPDNPQIGVADYVLSNFTQDEMRAIDAASSAIIDTVRSIVLLQ